MEKVYREAVGYTNEMIVECKTAAAAAKNLRTEVQLRTVPMQMVKVGWVLTPRDSNHPIPPTCRMLLFRNFFRNFFEPFVYTTAGGERQGDTLVTTVLDKATAAAAAAANTEAAATPAAAPADAEAARAAAVGLCKLNPVYPGLKPPGFNH